LLIVVVVGAGGVYELGSPVAYILHLPTGFELASGWI
jgi:hypothetical protein